MTFIPRIIHQTWKSKELPADFLVYQTSWKKNHPDWEYRFYDDDDCRKFIKENYSRLLGIYDGYPKHIQRIDMFRYLVVHASGGMYADMDMECLKPVDKLLCKKKVVFSIEAHLTARRQKELKYRYPVQIANCIFAAAPGQVVFDKIIEKLCELSSGAVNENEDVENITGPRMLTRLIEGLGHRLGKDITVLKQIHLMPSGYPILFPFGLLMYAKHHNAGSWKTKSASLSLNRIWIERNKLPPLW